MEEISKIHVGLDVHKDSISVAAAEPGRAPARLIGKVTHDVNKLLKVLAKIGTAEQLHLVYEGGPAGFGLQRALKATPGIRSSTRLARNSCKRSTSWSGLSTCCGTKVVARRWAYSSTPNTRSP